MALHRETLEAFPLREERGNDVHYLCRDPHCTRGLASAVR